MSGGALPHCWLGRPRLKLTASMAGDGTLSSQYRASNLAPKASLGAACGSEARGNLGTTPGEALYGTDRKQAWDGRNWRLRDHCPDSGRETGRATV